jgi:sugar O-acyltransferase (sialic acid O-acetyltransferase NeuD family)
MQQKIVIFGVSNILSDLFDCALANRLSIAKVVIHLPEQVGERDISLVERLAALAVLGEQPEIQQLQDFTPQADELYLLGPTTPTRIALATELKNRFGLAFTRLVHPTAYVSPLASLGEGVFVGANSVIGPGVRLAEHVFVNRGVTIGHDTHIGAFSRVQPGSNLGGLSRIGHSVDIAIGATVIERLVIGDKVFIGAGSVISSDIEADTRVLGRSASFKKLAPK